VSWSHPTSLLVPTSLIWAENVDALVMRICATAYPTLAQGFRATGGSRFDDPLKKFETLYCAADYATCYSEVMLRDGTFNPSTSQYEILRNEHERRSLALMLIDHTILNLVDLYGDGLHQMGFDNSTPFGSYSLTQRLARDLYEHKDKPHGIVYPSRLGAKHKPAIVLFDRAKKHIRLFPSTTTTELSQLRESFDALTKERRIALL